MNRRVLRICVPIPDRQYGGLYTFLRYFRAYLGRQGIDVTDRMDGEYDVLFANSFMVPFEDIRAARRRLRRLVVVHRVDGSAEDYGRDRADDRRQARVNLLADLTIFQSRYGRHATTRKFRVFAPRGVIIPNPVDTALFAPEGERMPLPGEKRVAYVSFSTNPRKGAPMAVRVARAHPDVQFLFAGRYEDIGEAGNVLRVGAIEHGRLPAFLRGCQALAFFSENETCPNVVLEALATGLPVLYLDSGGTGELVGAGGLPVTEASFGATLDRVMREHAAWSAAARRRAETRFALDVVLPRYEEAIRAARRRHLPEKGRMLWRAIRRYPVLWAAELGGEG